VSLFSRMDSSKPLIWPQTLLILDLSSFRMQESNRSIRIIPSSNSISPRCLLILNRTTSSSSSSRPVAQTSNHRISITTKAMGLTKGRTMVDTLRVKMVSKTHITISRRSNGMSVTKCRDSNDVSGGPGGGDDRGPKFGKASKDD